MATFGLVVLIFALVRAGRAALAPFAVGAYITAAYWWSSSTSFANPMIDVARTLSDTFAGIAPGVGADVPARCSSSAAPSAVAVVAAAVPARSPPSPTTSSSRTTTRDGPARRPSRGVRMTDDAKHLPGLLTPEASLHRLADDLAARFTGVFARETVDRYVFESYTALARTATVTAHLPVLAGRFATERLTALAQAKGAVAHDVPEVLFVCVQNAGRSQMAAALLQHCAAAIAVHVRSAGLAAGGRGRRRRRRPPWPRSASTSPRRSPSRSPTTSSAPPTSSSRWAAATPARSTRASATSTGRSATPPG